MRLTLASILILSFLKVSLAAPEISAITEPAGNGEVVVLTGEGLVQGKVKVKAAYLGGVGNKFDPKLADDPMKLLAAIGHMPEVPVIPPAGAMDCKVLGAGDGFLQVELHYLAQPWIHSPLTAAVWVGDDSGWSRPYVVNRPQARWLYPQKQAPGEVVRIFGSVFSWDNEPGLALAVVRKKGSDKVIPLREAMQHHEDGHTERWCLSAWLPDDLEAGEYELFVHGRHGSAFGWSDGLNLTVLPKPVEARRVVNLREHGAKGDGQSDDTAALEEGLKAAAGGGTLVLPAGTYAISRTVKIPEDVVMQGAAMQQTVIANLQNSANEPWLMTESRTSFKGHDLLQGMKRFTMRDMTLRFMPAQGSALRVGVDPQWSEDVILYRVRLETQQDTSLALDNPYAARPLTIIKARHISMTRCETYGPGGVSCERKVEDSLFAQNVFQTDRRWRGCCFKFWGAERCVFEDNKMTGDDRGLVMQTHFGVNYRNFIAGNTVERTVLGGNAGETYLIEGSGYLFESRVTAGGADWIKTARWPKVRGKDAVVDDCIGRFAVIARGRGLGQWRRIARCESQALEFHFESPWRVIPDTSSVVVVMNGLIENVFVNNQEIDCGKGIYIYGAGAINNVIDRHLCDRSFGVTIMAEDDRQGADAAEHMTAPDFFNLVRDCRVHDGGGLVCAAGGRLPLEVEPDAPLASFGNRFVDNEIQNVVPFSGTQYGANWSWGGGWNNLMAGINVIPMDLGKNPGTGAGGPPRMIGNVFSGNWVSGARNGVGVSVRAGNTLLYKNTFYDVQNIMTDHGSGTTNIDMVIRGDESYNPERSPIR